MSWSSTSATCSESSRGSLHTARPPCRRNPAGRPSIVTSPPGYSIHVDESESDLRIFERLVAQSHHELSAGDPLTALATVRRALDLWRGPALSNFPAGDVLTGHIVHLEELRIRAFEIRIECEEQLGRLRESIPDLAWESRPSGRAGNASLARRREAPEFSAPPG
ncbi:AfsR/SARP family transcriptional regulator [Streptomyces sp. NPDC003042]